MDNHRNRRSFCWPTLLIGVGLVWLLVNLGVIAPFNVSTILKLWPLLLIVLGMDILFAHRYTWIGSLLGLLAVAGVVGFLILAPRTGSLNNNAVLTEQFSEPVGDAMSADFNFETASEPVEIYSIGGATNLIDANLSHYGTIGFVVSGSTSKSIHLFENTDTSSWLNWNWALNESKWDIGLNSEIPASIVLDGGSGSINADLSELQLKSLTADLGSGSSNFTLPESNSSLLVNIDSGSGAVNLSLPEKTNLTLRIQSGSGAVNVSLPADAAVQVEVRDSGSGSLHLPSSLNLISGDSETGTWETEGYAASSVKILIQILDQGSGSVSIQ
ncbi:hypothetical protein SDC9_107448 [bioreactor metagenome]|uniref:Uncharacterized protein n=1 Tax=bioreactor metagenome TaxID=1076179 RepID=A0A645B6B1_9ZZZZ